MVILNEVELREPVLGRSVAALRGGNDEVPSHLMAMHLQQQHHFGMMPSAVDMSTLSSPATHQFGSLGRKITNGQPRSYQRLSTFRPMQGNHHADLVRECLEDGLNGPTYETIDPHHLSSQYGEYNCATTASGSSGSSCSTSGPGGGGVGCLPPVDTRLSPEERAAYGVGHRLRPQSNEYNSVLYTGLHSKEQSTGQQIYGLEQAKEFDIEQDQFSFFSALLTIISMASYVLDSASDVALSYLLYFEGNPYWFGLTAAITIFSAVTVNAFSIRWYLQDKQDQKVISVVPEKFKSSRVKWTLRIAAHLLFLGPVLRYFDLLRYGLWSRRERKRKAIEKQFQRDCHLSTLQPPSSLATLQRSNIPSLSKIANGNMAALNSGKDEELEYYLLMVHEDRDTALLSLLKSFLESGPQLVLQLYILAKRTESKALLDFVQVATIGTSLFELSWSLASYQRALRRSVPDKRNMTRMGTILQLAWRFLTISSRAVAVALFASEFGYWLLPVAIGHWGVMTVWVMHQGTRFCDTERGEPRPCEEYLLNMVIGAIYLLCFLNVKDEPTRYKYAAFYVITFLENTALITLWFLRVGADPLRAGASGLWYHVPALAGVIGAFCAGILFMLIYYRFFHPNGKPLWVNRAARCC